MLTVDQVTRVIVTTLRRELNLDDSVNVADGVDVRTLPNADSVNLLRTVGFVEEEFGIQFDDDLVFDLNSPLALAEVVVDLLTCTHTSEPQAS